MKRTVRFLTMAMALLGFAPTSQAAVITFDELVNLQVIDNEYAGLGVTFSSNGGNVNVVTTQPVYNSTQPNFLCTASAQGLVLNCTGDTIVDFATPVNNLSFDGLGINNTSADVAHIDVYENGLLSGTVIVSGNNESLNPVLVNLAAFSNITRIHINTITDAAGIGWDTFRFEPAGRVPEPGTLSLLGLALAGVAAHRRRAR